MGWCENKLEDLGKKMISETGVGQNSELGTIYPSDEWWKNKKFRLVIKKLFV